MKSTYLQSTAKKDRSGIVFFYTHVSVCVAQKSLCVSAPAQKHKPSHSPGNRLYVEADSFTLPFLEFSGQTEKVEVVVEWPSGNTLNVCMRCIVAWSPEELQEQTSATVQTQQSKTSLRSLKAKMPFRLLLVVLWRFHFTTTHRAASWTQTLAAEKTLLMNPQQHPSTQTCNGVRHGTSVTSSNYVLELSSHI